MEQDFDQNIKDQELITRFKEMRNELHHHMMKLRELESELEGHSLVIDTLQPLDQGRRCFRLIGGVLVERTIAEILPALRSNKESVRNYWPEVEWVYWMKPAITIDS
jgi:prefoldin subunit 2